MAAISLLGFIACDQNETEGTIYDAANNEASFAKASASYTFGTADPDEYLIKLQRGNASGAVNVPLTVTDDSGLFSIPTEASFADGAYETSVKVTFNRDNLEPGKAYPIKIAIPNNPIKERIVSQTLTITRDYVWVLFTSGTYTSGVFGDWPQDLYKVDGLETYKFPSIFVEGVDLVFSVDPIGAISLPGELDDGVYEFATGYVYGDYGQVLIYLDPDTNYSIFDRVSHSAIFSNYYITESGAGWGWKDDTFTW
ncbi:MAG: hypothetical protein LBO74_13440 [Candidatus Symbiothrix sp.]|nr:hypothetical protein [Candidatus Symbiothrix sp.]